jgi:ATP adenylyltransferase
MEVKFTPWRNSYITNAEPPAFEGCVLCGLHQAPREDDAKNFVLYRGVNTYVVMNLYPYNTAHLMVVPYEHTADLVNLAPEIAQELWDTGRWAISIIQRTMSPHGFNIGMNLGQTAGAGIAEHLHLHIVPRWQGDANFMPIVGGTKLIPEALDQTYARLEPLFNQPK